jgi:hypothetical protein
MISHLLPASRPSTAGSQPAAPVGTTREPADKKTTARNGFGTSVVHLDPAELTEAGRSRPAAHGKFHRTVADAGSAPAAHGPTLKQSNDPILKQSLELLGKYPGIVYGEACFSSATPDWARSNLGSLKAAGVTTLFVEIKNKNQPWISDFLKGKLDEDDFRSRMKRTTACSDLVGMANLIVEAKKLSINVVAMDVEDPTPHVMKDGLRVENDYDKHRLQYSNPAWAKTVNEKSNGAKYIMIAGNAHTNKINDPSLRGVDSILNIPSIDIFSNDLAINENKVADILGRKHDIPDSAIRPDANTIVRGTVETSDFIAVVPNPDGEPPRSRSLGGGRN